MQKSSNSPQIRESQLFEVDGSNVTIEGVEIPKPDRVSLQHTILGFSLKAYYGISKIPEIMQWLRIESEIHYTGVWGNMSVKTPERVFYLGNVKFRELYCPIGCNMATVELTCDCEL